MIITMGLSSSKFSTAGTLKGAFAPSLPNVVKPEKLDPKTKKYRLEVPEGKGAGDKITVSIKDHEVAVSVPDKFEKADGLHREIRPGDKFIFEWGDRDRVIASTLPSLPGAAVVEAKPILYANASHAFHNRKFNDRKYDCQRDYTLHAHCCR